MRGEKQPRSKVSTAGVFGRIVSPPQLFGKIATSISRYEGVEMVAIMAGLVFMLVVAIYSALALGKKTDERITRYLTEDTADSNLRVRFPNDVFRARKSQVSRKP